MASQKLQIRCSEIRSRLNEIAGMSELSDEVRAESDKLAQEYQDVELRHRAAIISEDSEPEEVRETPDSEQRERMELRSRAMVADFVAASLTGRGVEGASGEYASAVGVPGRVPLDLLGPVEERAVTPGPASETVSATRPTVPYAFARTDAAALGLSIPQVAAGEAHFPALTTAPPATMKAKDATADSTAAAFSLTKRSPGRLTGVFQIRMEDLSLLPSMETDLRTAIAAQLASSLDSQVINGNGTAPNLSGLFNQATDVAVAGAVETFSTGVSRFAGLVEGTHSNSLGDISALIGTSTYELYAGLFRGNNGDTSLADYLMDKLAVLRVSTRVPAAASGGQKGIAVLGAQGQPPVVPIWKGLELIVDPYSGAADGHRFVTAVALVGSPFVPYGTSQVVEVHPKLS